MFLKSSPAPWIALLALVTTGCGDAPDEPESRTTSRLEAPVAMVPGYAHTLGASKFQPGPAPVQRSEFGFAKTVGAYGVFSTFERSGWSAAVPNGDAPATRRPPLTTSGAEHDKRVLSYFVAAGLPADQVARVTAHATISQSGSVSVLLDPAQAAPKLDWYSSVLSRSIHGIEVPDSFAAARFNSDDEVVFESVFWPAIPVAVVNDALALEQQLAEPVTAAAFRAKLPPDLANEAGMVAIRHTGKGYGGAFVAKASYDVLLARPMSHVRHFDATATEFELPDLPSPAPQTSKP